MTHFDWRQRIGKAGERRVGQFVEETLKLAYRKVGDPDIGVDGMIEFADHDEVSSGGLLAVQVKATEESLIGKTSFRHALDEAHLDYFAKLVVQPILAVVSLADDAIWWKPILHKSNYLGPRAGYGITFHTGIDRLSELSKPLLKMLGERSNAMIAGFILEEVEGRLTEMDHAHDAGDFDVVTTESWGQSLSLMRNSLRDCECLLRYERRYSDEITAIEIRYHAAVERRELWRSFFKDWEIEEQWDVEV